MEMQVRETRQERCPRLIKASRPAGPRIRRRPKRPQPPPPPQADRSHERNATWRRDGNEMETGWRAPPPPPSISPAATDPHTADRSSIRRSHRSETLGKAREAPYAPHHELGRHHRLPRHQLLGNPADRAGCRLVAPPGGAGTVTGGGLASL